MGNSRPIEELAIAPPAQAEDANLPLYVVYTNFAATKWALQTATRLARELSARVTLLVAQVVPYPLPLDSPPIGVEFTERRLSELASQVQADITVTVFLCRDRAETIREAVRPGSIVVIGTRRDWWLNKERILARQLRRDGRHVILTEPERVHSLELRSAKVRTTS